MRLVISVETKTGNQGLIILPVDTYAQAEEVSSELRLRDHYRRVKIDGFYEAVVLATTNEAIKRALIE